MEADTHEKQEASRLKAKAESYYSNSNLKSALKLAKKAHNLCPDLDGLSSMLTAFQILRFTSKTPTDFTDWYKILQVEPFSHINTIKKQYKKLALVLHPDKNPYLGCEEAFKLVGEGFSVLSDKIRRKEYDMRMRIKLQEERTSDNNGVVDTFWTACSRCRLLHQFERRYLGHNLMCPSCKKTFAAVEVKEEKEGEEDSDVGETIGAWRERLKRKVNGKKLGEKENEELSQMEGDETIGSLKLKVKMGEKVNEELIQMEDDETIESLKLKVKMGEKVNEELIQMEDDETIGSLKLKVKRGNSGAWSGGRLRSGNVQRKLSCNSDEVLEKSKPIEKTVEDDMTLAQMQEKVKQKAFKEKEKLKQEEDGRKKLVEDEEHEKLRDLKKQALEKRKRSVLEKNEALEIATLDKRRNLTTEGCGIAEKSQILRFKRCRRSKIEDSETEEAEDSESCGFDSDRSEKKFKKGQVWAIYDDDRLPRRYGLLDEVVSVNPFKIELSWLDFQSHGEVGLTLQPKTGNYASCGRFKVSQMTRVKSLDIFSHVVDCERAAREVYRIYPKKGSVWAIYGEMEKRNPSVRDTKCYKIFVMLTSYSEMHGLSMACLEKVDGFDAVFKRREIGCHAISFLEKDDIWLLSHQIPAKKLVGDEISAVLKDCWELDQASLPAHLLTDGGGLSSN